MIEAEAAPGLGRVRRQQTGGARAIDELETQGIARAMRVLARIVLPGDDLVADEGGDPLAQLDMLGRQGEVDHEAASVVTGRRSSSAAARENIGSIARANRSQVGSGRRPLRCRCTLRQEIAPSR